MAERFVCVLLRKRELPEGPLLGVAGGRAVRMEAFEPDRRCGGESDLCTAGAHEERRFCLARLTAIASTTGG